MRVVVGGGDLLRATHGLVGDFLVGGLRVEHGNHTLHVGGVGGVGVANQDIVEQLERRRIIRGTLRLCGHACKVGTLLAAALQELGGGARIQPAPLHQDLAALGHAGGECQVMEVLQHVHIDQTRAWCEDGAESLADWAAPLDHFCALAGRADSVAAAKAAGG